MDVKAYFPIRRLAVSLVALSVAFVLTGCGEGKDKSAKTAETPKAAAGGPQQGPSPIPTQGAESGAQAGPPTGHPEVDKNDLAMHKATHAAVKGQKVLKLSREVKETWTEAKLIVMDNATKRSSQMTFKVGSAINLSDGFKARLEAVVPDYAISGNSVESRSNDPKNPAVLVTLLKGDKVAAKGWVFKNFPDFNSFNSDRFGMALDAPVKK